MILFHRVTVAFSHLSKDKILYIRIFRSIKSTAVILSKQSILRLHSLKYELRRSPPHPNLMITDDAVVLTYIFGSAEMTASTKVV